MSDCSAWEVSTGIGKTSPQCGHVISVWTLNSMFVATGLWPVFRKLGGAQRRGYSKS